MLFGHKFFVIMIYHLFNLPFLICLINVPRPLGRHHNPFPALSESLAISFALVKACRVCSIRQSGRSRWYSLVCVLGVATCTWCKRRLDMKAGWALEQSSRKYSKPRQRSLQRLPSFARKYCRHDYSIIELSLLTWKLMQSLVWCILP